MIVAPQGSPSANDVPAAWQAYAGLLGRMRTPFAVCLGSDIAHANAAAARLLGLAAPQAAIGRSIFSFVHRDYAALAELGLAVFAEEHSAVSIKLARCDGAALDVELSVTSVGQNDVFLLEIHDITEHLRAARALRLREQRLEGIINTVADGIITVDDRGLIQSFNPAAESIFGFHQDEVIGRNIRTLIPNAPLNAGADSAMAPMVVAAAEILGKRKDGEELTLEMAVRQLQQGEHLSFTSIVRDISARKAAEQRVFRKAYYDALTGLPNRHLFSDRVEEAFKRARRHGARLALLFVDLDRFKAINDTFGHVAGDAVLRSVALRLRAGVRATDTVARAGGDEFMVLLEELSDDSEAEEVRRKLHQLLAEPIDLGRAEVTIGASIGVAIYPDHAEDFLHLMDHADRDMYGLKRANARAS